MDAKNEQKRMVSMCLVIICEIFCWRLNDFYDLTFMCFVNILIQSALSVIHVPILNSLIGWFVERNGEIWLIHFTIGQMNTLYTFYEKCIPIIIKNQQAVIHFMINITTLKHIDKSFPKLSIGDTKQVRY